MKDFFEKCIAYATNNRELTALLAAVAVAALVVVIVLIVKTSRNRKRNKQAEEKRLAEEQANKQAEEKRLAEKQANKQAEEKRLAEEQAEKQAEEKRLAEKQANKQAEEKRLAEEQAKKQAEEATATEEEPVVVEEKRSVAKKTEKKTEKEKTTAMLYDELKDAEEEDDVWYEENETDKAARYSGKWLICRVLTDDNANEDETYFFELHASNGEKLLSSEEYTSYNGALRGIATHKTNIEKNNFKITLSKKGDYIFKLLSGKNMLLCMGEHYASKARCESAIESTKRFAKTAVIDENVQDYVVKVPVEDDAEIEPVAEGHNGKWIINATTAPDGEEVFYFELFANNGEKLLSSEEYTTYIGAVNGIHTHKTNIEKGNFRISLTKRGDYIYKLLNGNGQLLCLGEHYKTKRRCLNAVESVKRFALNSPLLTDQKYTK